MEGCCTSKSRRSNAVLFTSRGETDLSFLTNWSRLADARNTPGASASLYRTLRLLSSAASGRRAQIDAGSLQNGRCADKVHARSQFANAVEDKEARAIVESD